MNWKTKVLLTINGFALLGPFIDSLVFGRFWVFFAPASLVELFCFDIGVVVGSKLKSY